MGFRGVNGKRGSAVAAVLVLAATACSGSGSEPAGSPPDAAAAVTAALGGTQAPQDFLIHLDMLVQTADGPASYYDEVLDAAIAGSSEPVGLAAGFTYSAVTSLDGRMVDADGDDLPSIAVDFGLLGLAPAEFETSRALLVEGLAGAGYADLSALAAGADQERSQMLVELITADYAQTRTHAGPGDRAAVDLSFVTALAPGDTATSLHLFGQTLPGDPQAEAGLSAHELFAHRWNHGLISVLGTNEGVSAVVDAGVEVVEGSTITLQEVKAFGASLAGFQAGSRNAEQLLAEAGTSSATLNGVTITARHEAIALAKPGMYEALYLPRREVSQYVVSYMALRTATIACLDLLPNMLARNQAEAAGAAAARDVLETLTDPTPDLGDETADLAEAIDEIVNGRDPEDRSVDDLCGNVDAPDHGAVGGTFGDVHITTFDGWSYDNQAAGEFLLFDNGEATVQIRLAPWEDSDVVSVVTAAAVGVGEHAVSMHQGGHVRIDGEEIGLVRGEAIGVGDGSLLWTGTGWFIVWPDGTEVRVTGGHRDPLADPAEPNFGPLVVLIYPSERPAVGMTGSHDGDGANDWVTRSGEQLDSEIRFDFENFYPTYVDTWRISHDESLFHYEPGESTEAFNLAGFPRARFDAADVDPAVAAEAEAACSLAGVDRAELLEACTLDLAATGDHRFILDAYLVQSATTAANEPSPVSGDSAPPADGDSFVTVGPLSIGFGAAPPLAMANSAVQWECQSDEGSLFATSRFQESEDRSYKVTIEYLDAATSRTGDERFTMIVELNGDPIAWMENWIDPMPGSLDSVQLAGTILTASGAALLNQPRDPALFPGSLLPAGTQFDPFVLQVNCGE